MDRTWMYKAQRTDAYFREQLNKFIIWNLERTRGMLDLHWVRTEWIHLVKGLARTAHGRWSWRCTTCLHGCARRENIFCCPSLYKDPSILASILMFSLNLWCKRWKHYERRVSICLMVLHGRPLISEILSSPPSMITRLYLSFRDRSKVGQDARSVWMRPYHLSWKVQERWKEEK